MYHVAVGIMGDPPLNMPISKALPWLRLPSKYPGRADPFVELMVALLAAEGDKEDVVPRALWELDEARNTPAPGLRRKPAVRVEDVVDVQPRIVLVKCELLYRPYVLTSGAQ